MIDLYTAKQIVEQREIAEGLQKYQIIMDKLRRTDVSQNKYFQEVFCKLYEMKMYYSVGDFADKYFEAMEQMKRKKHISFKECFEKEKRYETFLRVDAGFRDARHGNVCMQKN